MKALIFDMDGLMIDSERLYFEVQQEIASRFGKKIELASLHGMMGQKPIDSIKLFIEQFSIPMDAEELLALRTSMMRKRLLKDLQPMPGLMTILESFYQRLRLAVATGAQQEFLDLVLDQLSLRDYFSVLQTSDGISRGKPDPEIYFVVCEKLGLYPAECIVLEDSANGVNAAKSAGCTVIAVPSSYTRTQNFSQADRICQSLLEARGEVYHFLDS